MKIKTENKIIKENASEKGSKNESDNSQLFSNKNTGNSSDDKNELVTGKKGHFRISTGVGTSRLCASKA